MMVTKIKGLALLVSIVVLQITKGKKSKFNEGSLDVRSGTKLMINTTSLTATLEGKSIVLGNRTGIAVFDGVEYRNHVVELKYMGNITFHKNSEIIIEGTQPLSIQSSYGNITIATNLSVTCKEKPYAGDTCLGGYMLNYTKPKDCKNIFRGLGPGGNKNSWCTQDSVIRSKCNGGAGHGGFGQIDISHKEHNIGQSYGKTDFKYVIGGSAGNTDSKKTYLSGGGAIEIKAVKGIIFIDAMIDARARVMGNTTLQKFSGSSGGLIRLKAVKVEMTRKASLNVDGSNGSNYTLQKGGDAGNGGGGGGVIQVNASQAQLYNLSLKAGSTYGCRFPRSSSPGCFVFMKDPSEINKTKECKDFIPFYGWPETLPSIDEQLVSVLEQLGTVKAEFEENFSNISDIFALLKQLENITSQNILTEPYLLKVLKIFERFKDILNITTPRLLERAKEAFGALLKVATFIISSRNQQNWKTTRKLPTFVTTLEEMGESIANHTTEHHYNTSLIAFQSISLEAGPTNYILPVHSKLPKDFISTEEAFVNVPSKALPESPRNFKAIVLIFKNIQDGLPESNKDNRTDPYKVVTLLTSYSLFSNGRNIKNLRSPALLHFRLYKQGTNIKCSFWNTTSDSWDSDGLSTHWTNTSNTVCSTTHLTSFAVLMQFTPTTVTELEELSLSLITYIGCSLSCFGFLITLLCLIFMKSLSSERHRIHLNLVIALMLAQVVFLSGVKATEIKLLCQFIAGTLHYLFLASFIWMLLEGVHLYLKVVRVFGVENVKIRYYCIIGWGIPVLIILIPAVLKPGSYGTKNLCWLSLEDGFVWAFIAPVLAIIAINSFILGIVIKTVMSSASAIP
ncbi:adhesion G-protein coupled receptor G2-like, partial [Actinia tenebrosa]|uniref:Adhesion G-protein coupled receptor G2-like n=1 Tax=Actinia tenebrosa TaxID=6105 RepID=A0A6P8IED8_ACTTE